MRTIEPGSPLPQGAPLPPRADLQALAAAIANTDPKEGDVDKKIAQPKPDSKEAQLRAMRERRAKLGDAIAKGGQTPDFLNRFKTMSAEELVAADERAARITARASERKIKNPPSVVREVTLSSLAKTPEAKAIAREIEAKKKAADKARAEEKKEAREIARKQKPKAATAVPTSADGQKPAADQQESAMRSTTTKTPKAKAKSSARTPVKAKASTKGKPANGKSKVALIAGLLTRKEGCTTADVLKACDWPSVSMPQQAKAAGLKLRKEMDGKVTRYYAA